MYRRRGHSSYSGYDSMNYSKCWRELHSKAEKQARCRIAYRDQVDLHGNYAVHLHGTHVWVRKREWDKLPAADRLKPGNYFESRDYHHDDFCYAIPVPGTPIHLKLHRTDIATLFANGNVVLRAAGWETATTKKWMDTATPSGVRIGNIKPSKWDASEWGVRDRDNRLSRFYDGITLNAAGCIITEIRPFAKSRVDREKMRPFIAACAHFRKLAAPYVELLQGNPLPEAIDEELQRSWPSDDVLREHILTLPSEPDMRMIGAMVTSDNYYARNKNLPRTDAHARFEQNLRRLRAQWTRSNALVADDV